MRKIFSLFLVASTFFGVFGQNPELVTTNSDVIGLSDYPTSPLLIEAGPESFYWIGGSSQGSIVDHPLLNDKVSSDFSNVYFIKYDELGNPIASAAISGTNYMPSAFSTDGGLTLMGVAYEDVLANGNNIPIGAADKMEYIARYNDLCQFERIVPVWDLDPSQYPNSRAMMDELTGDLYLAGISYQPYNLVGHGILGKELGDYFYVLKYDRNLALTGVFTAGFNALDTLSGYYKDLRIIPAGESGVIITGNWQGDRSPEIGGVTLSKMPGGQGVFALKLDGAFRKEWVLEGSFQGADFESFSGISEGKTLSNGDIVMLGATSTGHFSLGELKLDYPNGAGSSNMFAFRMSPEGKEIWARPLENKDEAFKGKKGTSSDEFTSSMKWDGSFWKEEVLYLTGKFTGNEFVIAGKQLPNGLGTGGFVAALDMRTGEEIWGYSLSATMLDIHGFDADGSGNVSLMGRTASNQVFEDIATAAVDAAALTFHLGLSSKGRALWLNNAYTADFGAGFYGCDLEVLRNGEVFSTLYKTVPDPLLVGGSSVSSKDVYSTMLLTLNADNILGGKIIDKYGNPLFPGVVRAYKITNYGAYPLVKEVDIDNTGTYAFTGLLPGNYALRAIPDYNAYPDGMPTYAGGGIVWSALQTDEYDVAPDTRATFLDISLSHLDPLTEMDGSGMMSGNISYADDFISKGTLARPVTQTAVILKKKASSKGTQEEDIVAYIETNEFGEYYFEYVPNGEYNMIVDIPGLNMIENYDVEIVDNTIVGDLDFVVENNGITIPGATGFDQLEKKMAQIYPNPGNGYLQINFLESDSYQVRVFSTMGQMLDSRYYPDAFATLDLDLTNLDQGIYLISIEGSKGRECIKYIIE